MKFLYYALPVLIILGISYAFFFNTKSVDVSDFSKSFYDYSAISIDGDTIPMEKYKDKKVLIVNVASKCGYTYQYEDLQKLNENYSDKVVVLGFPSNDFLYQEPGSNEKIKEFCSTNYGVTFQMFEKIVVKKNEKQHPLYSWLSFKELNAKLNNVPSWNFCKYLINENGEIVAYFNSKINPLDKQILEQIK